MPRGIVAGFCHCREQGLLCHEFVFIRRSLAFYYLNKW